MKKLNLHLFTIIFALALFSACDWIEYHPYDTRVDGPRNLNAQHIAQIEQEMRGRDSLRFAVLSDTQRWYDETAAAVDNINKRNDVDFVLHLGDLTDFGITREFEWMHRELDKLDVPYVCLIGNHDCLGTGTDVFQQIYGNPDFSFNAGDTHFLCLNTNAFEYDYSMAIPNFSFMKSDREYLSPEIRRTIVAMHAAPTSDQFNNNVADVFHDKIRAYPALQFCLSGHNHAMLVFEPLEDGITYYQCGAAKHREYILLTLTTDGDTIYEIVAY